MKKGFTLIELLSVILILGIIDLIAGEYKYHNSWFSDASRFPNINNPFIHCGGNSHGVIAGTTDMRYHNGEGTSSIGFRIVLSS